MGWHLTIALVIPPKNRNLSLPGVLLLLICCVGSAYADPLVRVAFGRADNQQEAVDNALFDLRHQIQIAIQRRLCEASDQCSQTGFYWDYPLLGVKQNTVKSSHGSSLQEVRLSAVDVEKVYSKKIKELEQILLETMETSTGRSKKHRQKNQQISTLSEIQTYLHLFDVFNIALPKLSNATRESLASYDKIFNDAINKSPIDNSIETMVKNIAANIGGQDIYVYSPNLKQSKVITDTSFRIRAFLDRELNNEEDKNSYGEGKLCRDKQYDLAYLCQPYQRRQGDPSAKRVLLGEYFYRKAAANNDDELVVIYRLLELGKGVTTIHIGRMQNAKKLSDFHLQQGNEIETLLSQINHLSSTEKIHITTSRGSRNLVLHEGDKIDLLARLESPGYIHLLGHTAKAESQYSYLAPIIFDEPSKRSKRQIDFIRHIDEENIYRWINLGSFTVKPPFGTEYLQLFASDQAPDLSQLKYTLDKRSGYYVVKGSQQQIPHTIKRVRGLKRLCSSIQSAEGSSINGAANQYCIDDKKRTGNESAPRWQSENVLSFSSSASSLQR